MKKFFLITVPLLLLNGCSSKFVSNGESVYMKSRNGMTLEVPSPLTRSNISYFYVLPQQNQNSRVSIIPPDSTIPV